MFKNKCVLIAIFLLTTFSTKGQNLVDRNGLKQGKWDFRNDNVRMTCFYKNDSIISKIKYFENDSIFLEIEKIDLTKFRWTAHFENVLRGHGSWNDYYLENGQQLDDNTRKKITSKTEISPRFYSGNESYEKYVSNILKNISNLNLDEGKYTVYYTINQSGKSVFDKLIRNEMEVHDVQIIKYFTSHLNEIPNWQPGIQRHRTVRVRNLIPFTISTE